MHSQITWKAAVLTPIDLAAIATVGLDSGAESNGIVAYSAAVGTGVGIALAPSGGTP